MWRPVYYNVTLDFVTKQLGKLKVGDTNQNNISNPITSTA